MARPRTDYSIFSQCLQSASRSSPIQNGSLHSEMADVSSDLDTVSMELLIAMLVPICLLDSDNRTGEQSKVEVVAGANGG